MENTLEVENIIIYKFIYIHFKIIIDNRINLKDNWVDLAFGLILQLLIGWPLEHLWKYCLSMILLFFPWGKNAN